MRIAIGHYIACRQTCACTGCRKGLGVTLYLEAFSLIQKAGKKMSAWAYRMEMKAY